MGREDIALRLTEYVLRDMKSCCPRRCLSCRDVICCYNAIYEGLDIPDGKCRHTVVNNFSSPGFGGDRVANIGGV